MLMTSRPFMLRSMLGLILVLSVSGPSSISRATAQDQAGSKRPMTFLDMQMMRNAGSPAPAWRVGG